MLKLKKDVKAMWLAALRGGDYEQGKNRLRTTHSDGVVKYCCLGVLCDLAAKAGVGRWSGDVFVVANDDTSETLLPLEVAHWAHEEFDEGEFALDPMVFVAGTPERRPLSVLNDDGTSFTDIANAIERDL